MKKLQNEVEKNKQTYKNRAKLSQEKSILGGRIRKQTTIKSQSNTDMSQRHLKMKHKISTSYRV